MTIEAAWLVASRRARADAVLWLILPGALMLLALRAALTGAAWPFVALPLAMSLPAHLADLYRRGWIGGARR